MHFAARSGHYLIVKFLCDLGCPANTQNVMGLTPLQFMSSAWMGDDFEKVEIVAMKQKGKAKQEAVRTK